MSHLLREIHNRFSRELSDGGPELKRLTNRLQPQLFAEVEEQHVILNAKLITSEKPMAAMTQPRNILPNSEINAVYNETQYVVVGRNTV